MSESGAPYSGDPGDETPATIRVNLRTADLPRWEPHIAVEPNAVDMAPTSDELADAIRAWWAAAQAVTVPPLYDTTNPTHLALVRAHGVLRRVAERLEEGGSE